MGLFQPLDTGLFATAENAPQQRARHPTCQNRVDDDIGQQKEVEHDQRGVEKYKKIQGVFGGLQSLACRVLQEELVEQGGPPPKSRRRQLPIDEGIQVDGHSNPVFTEKPNAQWLTKHQKDALTPIVNSRCGMPRESSRSGLRSRRDRHLRGFAAGVAAGGPVARHTAHRDRAQSMAMP